MVWTRRFAVPVCVALLVALAGCHGGSSSAPPFSPGAPGGGGVPTATPTSAPTSAPITGSGPASAAQVQTAGDAVIAHWKTLAPAGNPTAALTALAAFIKTQPGFVDAGVDLGAVWGLFGDGSVMVFYADHLDGGGTTTSSVRRAAPAATPRALPGARPRPGATRPPAVASSLRRAAPAAIRHTAAAGAPIVAFAVYDLGDPAFTAQRQHDFGQAMATAGYATNFQVQAPSFSLEWLQAQAGTPFAMFDVSTHGGIARAKNAATRVYTLSTTTLVNSDNFVQYSPSVRAGQLVYGRALVGPDVTGADDIMALSSYGVTSAWLISHMTFVPGALVDNQSCLGASPDAAVQSFITDLENAGAGLYMGWTKSVEATDSDETDAYIVDRLIGEQSPAVNAMPTYVSQQSPPQRPFQLTDILINLPSKMRTNPIRDGHNLPSESLDKSTAPAKYDVNSSSPPASDGPLARFTYIGAGNAPPVTPIVPPSIAYVVVDEAASPQPTLSIYGEFSAQPGGVLIRSGGDTELTVLSWSTSQIVAQLPSSAPANGQVIVGEDNVPSNFVPLTEWDGTYTLTRSYVLGNTFGGPDGSGHFAYTATLNMKLRSDVHSFATSIDGPTTRLDFVPLPMRSSTGTVVAQSGSWQSAGTDPQIDVTYSPKGSVALQPLTTITATNGTLDNLFNVQPAAQGQPATAAGCSQGVSTYPQDPHFAVYCTAIQVAASVIATCSDNQSGTYCGGTQNSAIPAGLSTDMYGSAQIGAFRLVLDPSTYTLSSAITPPSDPNANGTFYGGITYTETTTWSASFGAPVNPPNASTPAAWRRRSR
ncbi:MAG TPA: hypothetical protein VHT05_02825 [Candidatus Elarobacter sp.]|nr:hypothetical protein [Candidatus Elarobacter sp.]